MRYKVVKKKLKRKRVLAVTVQIRVEAVEGAARALKGARESHDCSPRVQAVQKLPPRQFFLHRNTGSLFMTVSLHFINLDGLSIIFIH
jgi:hypothetical protein